MQRTPIHHLLADSVSETGMHASANLELPQNLFFPLENLGSQQEMYPTPPICATPETCHAHPP